MTASNGARKSFFRYTSTRDSIHSIVVDRVRRRMRLKQFEVLDSRNMLGYKHGVRWSIRNATDSDEISQMQSINAEYKLYQDEIINHNTRIIENYISKLTDQLFGNFMRGLYDMVGKVSDSVGNSVDMQDHGGNFAQGFLKAMQNIEFGVDRYGRASPPTIHVGTSAGPKILKELESQPPEYHIKIEELKANKEKLATIKEAERISRYRWNRD